MEITNFVTENFLSSFAGTLVAVELIVFTTKNFPIIKKMPTKLYTFILAVMHLIIVQVSSGKVDITVEFVYILCSYTYIQYKPIIKTLSQTFDDEQKKRTNKFAYHSQALIIILTMLDLEILFLSSKRMERKML